MLGILVSFWMGLRVLNIRQLVVSLQVRQVRQNGQPRKELANRTLLFCKFRYSFGLYGVVNSGSPPGLLGSLTVFEGRTPVGSPERFSDSRPLLAFPKGFEQVGQLKDKDRVSLRLATRIFA